MFSFYRAESCLEKPLARRDAIVCITRYIYVYMRMYTYVYTYITELTSRQNTEIYFKKLPRWVMRSTAAKSIRVEMYTSFENPRPSVRKERQDLLSITTAFSICQMADERTTWLAVFDKVERRMRASAHVILDWTMYNSLCQITEYVNLS